MTFDDFGDTPQAIRANTVTAGTNNSFGGATGGIAIGATTAFSNTVSGLTSTPANPLDSLEVTVNIVDSSDNYLSLNLVAPSGASYTLVLNEFGTDTGIGISGANLGVVTYSNNNIGQYAVGTTFTDTATRDIFDTTTSGTNGNSAPILATSARRTFRPWINFSRPRSTPPTTTAPGNLRPPTRTRAASSPEFVVNWSLSFGHGLNAATPVTVPDPIVGNYFAGPIAGVVGPADNVTSGVSVPSSPIDIGVGLVMAQDNTLGANSPYEGRIYAAFVGYINVTINGFTNPTTNTDVFLVYSDNDGRTWSTPVEVNNDSGQVDGFTGGSETNPNDLVDGSSQYAATGCCGPDNRNRCCFLA